MSRTKLTQNSIAAGAINANTMFAADVVGPHAIANTSTYSVGELLVGGTILLDNTGVITGPSSITSTAFVGALTGNVTGNASGTAATVTTAAQPAITSVGTLTAFRSTGIDDNSNALAMTIDSSENVGIGTAAPTEKLEVAGNVILDVADAHINLKSGGGGTSGAVNWTYNTDSTVYASIKLPYDTRATLGLITETTYPISLQATGSSGFIRFQTYGTERMRLTNTGLGIGTTAPEAKLHVIGNASGLNDGTIALFEGNNVGGNRGIHIGQEGSGSQAWPFIQAYHSQSVTNYWNLLLNPYGGNVGIGTTVNSLFNSVGGTTKLAVVGDSASNAVLGNTDASISIINKDGTLGNTAGLHFARADTDETPNYAGASIVAQFLAAQVTGQYPAADMNFLTSTSQNAAPSFKMILTAAGRLGIGTATPVHPLTVTATGSTSTFSVNPSSTLTVIGTAQSSATNSALFIDTKGTGATNFRNGSGATMLMSLTSSGLGIGTTAPNTKIDVIGSSTGGSGAVDTIRLRHTGTTVNDGPRLQFTAGTSTSGAAIASQGKALNSADLLFYAGGNTERMRIDSSGRFTLGYQPRFLAQRSSNQTNYVGSTQSQAVLYDSAVQNVGNHFNTSTGKFTAPVAGMYAFQASVYSNNSFAQAWLVINGSRPSYGDVGVSATAGAVFAATWIFYLAANDTVGYHPYNASSSNQTIYVNSIHTWFKGYLIS